jgi:hypothetical protein
MVGGLNFQGVIAVLEFEGEDFHYRTFCVKMIVRNPQHDFHE